MPPSDAHGRDEDAGAVVSRPRASSAPKSPARPARKTTPEPGGHCRRYATACAISHVKLAVPFASDASGEKLAAPPISRTGRNAPIPGDIQLTVSAPPRRGLGAGPVVASPERPTPNRGGGAGDTSGSPAS